MFFHLLRQLQIIESEAALAPLHNDAATNNKAIVHFDTTTQNNIDSEWRSIILCFSALISKEYQLRPHFFADEDCEQITRLFCETFEQLASAVIIQERVIIQAGTL